MAQWRRGVVLAGEVLSELHERLDDLAERVSELEADNEEDDDERCHEVGPHGRCDWLAGHDGSHATTLGCGRFAWDGEEPSDAERAEAATRHWQAKVDADLRGLRADLELLIENRRDDQAEDLGRIAKLEADVSRLRDDLDATTVCARESQKAILAGDVGTEAAAIRRDVAQDLRGVNLRLAALESRTAVPAPVQQCDAVSADGPRCELIAGHVGRHYVPSAGGGYLRWSGSEEPTP